MNVSEKFAPYQLAQVREGKAQVAEQIKIILYKTMPDWFGMLDFENDDIFLDPYLFAILNAEKGVNTDLLKQAIYGNCSSDDRPLSVKVQSDRYGNCYLPRLGWITGLPVSCSFMLTWQGNRFVLDGNPCRIEPISSGNKLGVELIRYPLEVLDNRFYDGAFNPVDVDVTGPYKRAHHLYNKALDFITDHLPWMAELIRESCQKSLIFDDRTDPVNDTYCKRNSFASFKVKSISFHNIYQPWYDEVFFLDDISHQMGHVIFDYMTTNKKKFYRVNHEEIIKSNSTFGRQLDELENRTHEIVFHSLYTFFLIHNVLDKALESGLFTPEQEGELKGRIAFYIRKAGHDFELFEEFDKNEVAARTYTPDGMYIYTGMKQSFSDICAKYNGLYHQYDMGNQTYNYNHHKFLERNQPAGNMVS